MNDICYNCKKLSGKTDNHPGCLNILGNRGVIFETNDDGMNALHYFVIFNDCYNLEKYINRNKLVYKDYDFINEHERSVLHPIFFVSSINCLKILVKHGVNINAMHNEKYSFFCNILHSFGFPDETNNGTNNDTVKYLLQLGINFDFANKEAFDSDHFYFNGRDYNAKEYIALHDEGKGPVEALNKHLCLKKNIIYSHHK
jgi:hypothetical protein